MLINTDQFFTILLDASKYALFASHFLFMGTAYIWQLSSRLISLLGMQTDGQIISNAFQHVPFLDGQSMQR